MESLSMFARSRLLARELFNSTAFQICTAFLIIVNFGVNAVEAEMTFNLIDDAGNPSNLKEALDRVDFAMTVIFTMEIALNMYGSLVWEFISDGWSLFDLFIVVICTHMRATRAGKRTRKYTHRECVHTLADMRVCTHGKGKSDGKARKRETMTQSGL